MQGSKRRTTWAVDGARLAVLPLLLAGFLSMHGFLAVSAAAESHASVPSMTSTDMMAPVAPGPAVGDGPAEPGPGNHAPVEHHGVLAGCVVALVGVALLTLGVVSWARRRSALMGRADRVAAALRQVLADGPGGWSPARFALCVIRV